MLAALCGLLVIAASAPAPAGARSADPVIRVLLLETRRSVTVRDQRTGADGIVLEPRASGLSADRRPVGDVWRVPTHAGLPTARAQCARSTQ